MNEDLRHSFSGKRVLVTGHTGFKGAWLTLWLKLLEAEVLGVSLDPEHKNGAFNAMDIPSICIDIRQDINDLKAIQKIFSQYQPQVVFHMAAQALVLESYNRPVDTFQTNIIGTTNVLEACRQTKSVKTIVVITSDKCYDNIEVNTGYKETDRLGGNDPYSVSKASAELVTNSYWESFFAKDSKIGLATVRAGNVIGGGDWAQNRIVPDCIKALVKEQPIEVRNPEAVRPWQYVLEPLRGYLSLASKLMKDPKLYSSPWNFGPEEEGKKSVSDLVSELITAWGKGKWTNVQSSNQSIKPPHEAKLLSLDITKAKNYLNWYPLMSFSQSIKQTVHWYKACANGDNMKDFGIKQILDYQELIV